jgi:hypothetical protein
VFTFGRKHELEHAARFIGTEEKARLLLAAIERIHDLLEGAASVTAAETALAAAIAEGPAGVWESAGSWLRKLNGEHPSSRELWRRLAEHPSATVRFRVASFLDELPDPLASDLYQALHADKSRRVSKQAEGKWDYRVNRAKYRG